MAKDGERSPWVYVGIGCGVILVLILVAVVAVIVMGYRFARDMGEQFTDPVARTERAAEILGADSLPEGYNAMMTMSIPVVAEVVVLSDNEPDAEGKIESFDSTGFVYLNSLQKEADRRRMQDYFEGRIDLDGLLRNSGLDLHFQGDVGFDPEEEVSRGTIERDDVRIVHVTNSGRVKLERGWADGLATLMMMECPSDSRLRLGIWFASSGDGEAEAATGLEESIADPAAIREFTDHFRPCG